MLRLIQRQQSMSPPPPYSYVNYLRVYLHKIQGHFFQTMLFSLDAIKYLNFGWGRTAVSFQPCSYVNKYIACHLTFNSRRPRYLKKFIEIIL